MPARPIARGQPITSASAGSDPLGSGFRHPFPIERVRGGSISRLTIQVGKLVTAGVEMDVLGIGYADFSDADREAVVRAYPRSAYFKEDIIRAFYDGIKHKPQTTFGNVKADVLADKDPSFQREDFCTVARRSAWRG